ncbi:MAG: hypothetical protein WDN50_19100 [Bradyrhizobium sp.]
MIIDREPTVAETKRLVAAVTLLKLDEFVWHAESPGDNLREGCFMALSLRLSGDNEEHASRRA